jgi:hypothetical protein
VREISVSIEIAAPPEAVWAVLADLPAYARWNPFLRQADGVLAVGERLRIRFHPENGRPITFEPVVISVEPGRELLWKGRLLLPGIFDGRHRFLLEETGAGTLLTQSEIFTGLLVPFVTRSLRSTVHDFTRLNRALKDQAEGRERGSDR